MHLNQNDEYFSEKHFPTEWKVPQGTYEKLLIYFALVQKWNPKINIVSDTTLDAKTFWNRHALDSMQLVEHLSPNQVVCDIGSGGGFPALVLAAAGYTNIHCIESDVRKCEFIREAARQMGVGVTIHNNRSEALTIDVLKSTIDVITARACATLSDLFKLSFHLVSPQTKYVILKGKNAENEIEKALHDWQFDVALTPSVTEELARLITITNLSKRRENDAKK